MPASASVSIGSDGCAIVSSSAQEMGMGTSTVQTQHAAERLGLPMEKVRFVYGDSDLPPAPVAGGSNQTVSVSLAVQQACETLHRELLKAAAKSGDTVLADAKYEDVVAVNSGLYLRADGRKGESYAQLLAKLGKASWEASAKTGAPEEMKKYSMGSYGAQFCEVRVSQVTGEVRVQRWLGVFDGGRILNDKTARSQFYGGIVMGIGMALTEETLFDERSATIVNPSLAEYHLPVNADVPNIEVEYLDIPDPVTSVGAHGIGEIGITGVAAAIANAVYHATGVRVRSLPMTPDKILTALPPD
jgi:xanthine dehydrogenase YagR molybdenum-binding subunit